MTSQTRPKRAALEAVRSCRATDRARQLWRVPFRTLQLRCASWTLSRVCRPPAAKGYDPADRLLPGGTSLAYDAFGRTTTLPAALSGASSDVTIGFYTRRRPARGWLRAPRR
jgi:hypothetical protein